MKPKTKSKRSITRRWRNARPGSVLILVVALLVLLALIGTAYLSSTQGERYTSSQNTINTEADLLIQGMVDTVNATVANGLFGSNSAYRPPQQEMPLPAGAPALGYNHYTSTTTDMFLGDRLPTIPASTGVPSWNAISWPMFLDSSAYSTFDSPFEQSAVTYLPANKSKIVSIPAYKTFNSQQYPGVLYYVPSALPNLTTLSLANSNTITIPAGGAYLTPNGVVPATTTPAFVQANPAAYPTLINYAGSASGDGIADAGFVKLPVGPIDGITYYVAVRIIDGNSAINASSAWTQGPDIPFTGNPATNYGFFRTNIGLQELLWSNGAVEIANLNIARFPNQTAIPANVPPAPTNFSWYSIGNEVDSQLISRPGNPGLDSGSSQPMTWFGMTQSAALAYKFTLLNPNGGFSPVEINLAKETTGTQSTPYAPTQIYSATSPSWWTNNFSQLFPAPYYHYTGSNGGSPLRTILVGNNAVSNATPGRLGNTSSGQISVWSPTTVYHFGDWVTDGPAGQRRSFVCICQHTSSTTNEPGTGVNPQAVGYWAGAVAAAPLTTSAPQPGLPWTQVPVKTSVNTATFEQLWLGFAQVMTDSVSLDSATAGPSPTGAVAQWQPPMQPTTPTGTNQPQLGQFRSVIRSSSALPSARLTSSQMLKLRAALAAVNTLDLRDSDDDVTSRHISLPDASGAPQYDVEVYGTEKQPYISEVVIQADGTPKDTYIAVELSNPYPQPLVLTGWQIASINRNSTPLTVSAGVAIPKLTIPAAMNGVPGTVILDDNETAEPTDIQTTISSNEATYATTSNTKPILVNGLANAAIGPTFQPNEFFVMRPRRYDGQPSSSTGYDVYTEASATTAADLVPVDQLDLTGISTIPTVPGSQPVRYSYRRATDGRTGLAWNMIYPGCYDPTNGNASGRYFYDIGEGATAIQTDMTAKTPCALAAPKADPNAALASDLNSTFATVPIELNNRNMGGPNPVGSAGNTFPYGAFARNGDMLQIPFIGAYRIRPVGAVSQSNVVTELNSVSIDSALAYDNSAGIPVPSDESPATANGRTTVPTAFTEQIGRFCPIGNPAVGGAEAADFGTNPAFWHYHWAKRLFDYLTVQAPSDDYYPNYDPSQGDSTTSPAILPKYPGGNIPQSVDNTDTIGASPNASIAGRSEDTTGVEGLININTAPEPVIAQLPFTTDVATNAKIAQNIVADRIANGPFTSIFDLYRVNDSVNSGFSFRQQNDALLTPAPGPAQGIFSPGTSSQLSSSGTPTGTTRYDFQERFLLLNKISNLVTTRSDTFTCYILLQGWRNVGTASPTLVVQRRAAFLLDRGTVTPTNTKPFNFPVPTD